MDRYAGKVWAVYHNATDLPRKFATSGTVIAMFSSQHGAEGFIEGRKRKDALRGEEHDYSIVPWLISR